MRAMDWHGTNKRRAMHGMPERQGSHPWLRGLLNIIGFSVILVMLFLAAVFWLATFARAHGAAEWIERGGYKNAAGELCCGERDCVELSDADVKVTSGGYLLGRLNEFIPFSEASPSPTGTYWRCAWGGMRKCFFAPPGQT